MIYWFNRDQGSDISISEDDPAMVLIGSDNPDWARLPPELGGDRLRVLGSRYDKCACGRDHEVRWYDMEQNYCVAECSHMGFLWCRKTAI